MAATLSISVLSEAQRVLEIEGHALLKLSQAIPPDYVALVERIIACSSRVIVSGIGKSGHIARKISATLASTGTAAQFVHAAEASHGDLGMIGQNDIVLCLSNSGETPELGDLIAYTRRFSIPLAAISSVPNSSLMRAADYQLLLPPEKEACIIGLAPTTSTTMMLALGDAIAVSLMSRRNFLPQDFGIFHPGGKLGAQMSRVEQLMHTGSAMPLVAPDTPMRDALLTMTSKGFGIAGVVEGQTLIGTITDGDLRRNMSDLIDRTASEIANPTPITAHFDTLSAEALAVMNNNNITALFIIDSSLKPIGVLHVHDCLRAGVA